METIKKIFPIVLPLVIIISCGQETTTMNKESNIDSTHYTDSLHFKDSIIHTNWLKNHEELRDRIFNDTIVDVYNKCVLDISYIRNTMENYNIISDYVIKAELKVQKNKLIKDTVIYLVNDDQYNSIIVGCAYHQRVVWDEEAQ